MHGGTMVLDACFQSTAMRIQPLELRQQRRMDVEHLAAPTLHKPRRQQPHETGEAYELDPIGFKRFIKSTFEPFTILDERRVIDDCGRDAFLTSAGQAGCRGPV